MSPNGVVYFLTQLMATVFLQHLCIKAVWSGVAFSHQERASLGTLWEPGASFYFSESLKISHKVPGSDSVAPWKKNGDALYQESQCYCTF